MAKDPRKLLGDRGEQIAASFLRKEGYAILDRNWRCSTGEIDIIARDGECICFVEVRTRRGDRGPTPEQSITVAKQTKLIELGETYLQTNNLPDALWRIDVVAVGMDSRGLLKRVDLVRNAVSGW